ncbi:hypothetical protein AVEN_35946-1 [Araneus ventricosus]|uniref:Uncharacterized protein n=1 Tax=Araneus ventricosus TaxID=182803 RepID=A0A4Y2H2H9_ARAVE|nr:hypothetical protein AVEN_35946-1 [Araneus ventricosus]
MTSKEINICVWCFISESSKDKSLRNLMSEKEFPSKSILQTHHFSFHIPLSGEWFSFKRLPKHPTNQTKGIFICSPVSFQGLSRPDLQDAISNKQTRPFSPPALNGTPEYFPTKAILPIQWHSFCQRQKGELPPALRFSSTGSHLSLGNSFICSSNTHPAH